MGSNFVSTFNLLNGPRLFARNAQAQVARLNQELVTERFSDVGLILGNRTGRSTLLYQELARVDALKTSNSMTTGRIGATQTVVSDLRNAADTFMATLVGLPTNATSAETVRGEAERNLTTLIDKLNSAFAGQSLFSGIKTDIEPATNASGEVKTAFNSYLAYLPPITVLDPPGVRPATASDVTADQMNAFLAGDFATQFDDTNWEANWSSASNVNIQSQVSATETMTTSVNANESAFRFIARAYNALGSIPSSELNDNAFQAVVKYAIEQLGEGVNGLTVMEANLGASQSRIKAVNEQLTVQKAFLNNTLVSMEGVDPYEAKVKLDAVELQINLSYSLTVRLQKLNLLNYI